MALQRQVDRGRIIFRSPLAFYAGCAAVTFGVLLHMPMVIQARSMHYVLAGMSMSPSMIIGMLIIVAGLFLVGYGVTPPVGAKASVDEVHRANSWSILALDDAPLGPEHWRLIAILGVALIIDIMKPASLAFVVPGMRLEYGLTKWTVALFPFSALTGTAIGSLVWGWYGDRIGRRATILFAAIMFMGTAICGAMPAFGWNILMCFLMGLSAGGLLPIAISLLCEILPVRSRAPLVVLLGGIGAAGGYLVASWAATALIPTFSWRVMWFLNFPTGAILLLLNRYIPESPRFLISFGRIEEANQIIRRFRAGALRRDEDTTVAVGSSQPHRAGTLSLFRQPYVPQTIAIALYGVAWGLVNYGFLLWLPTNLQNAGFGEQTGNAILAKSALVAFPGALLVAWLYAKWSSKLTMVLAGFLTTVSLLAFLPLSHDAHQHTFLLATAIVALLVSSSAMASTLSPYSAEVYPTSVRATGSGLAAGSGKFGGLTGQGAVLAHLTPSLAIAAPLVAVPVALALTVLAVAGHETRGQRLEESSGEMSRHSVTEPVPV
jgi:MFS transporter, putative metabolite:H+ symporter